MKPNLAMGYAADFVGFLIAKLTAKDLSLIREIIFFGSSARGEAKPESDIDLFIDTSAPKQIERQAEAAWAEFEDSVKVKDYWRLLGVRYPISLKVGEARSWTSLADALREDGRVLYGRYRPEVPEGTSKILLSWENVRSGNARTNLYRNIFGYTASGKRYDGLLARHGGERVTKGAILISLDAMKEFQELFRKLRVTCRVRPVFEAETSRKTNVPVRRHVSARSQLSTPRGPRSHCG
jgi:predicted nucleotidyltransferase